MPSSPRKTNHPRYLRTDDIVVPPTQRIRADDPDPDLLTLADSIARYGVLNPITVTPVDGTYHLVAGARRLAATKLAGHPTIPVHVVLVTPREARALTAVENIARKDLTPVEEAAALRALLDAHDNRIDQVCAALHRSEDWIYARLEILDWPPRLQEAVHHRRISPAAARVIASIPADAGQDAYIDQAVAHGITAATATLWKQQALTDIAPRPQPLTTHNTYPQPTRTYITLPTCFACNQPTEPALVQNLHFCPACADHLARARHTLHTPTSP